MDRAQCQLVLGRLWLVRHNPRVDWRNNAILEWSPLCLASCLKSALCPTVTSGPPEDFPDLSVLPHDYIDLKAVFSKSRAVSLPPHRPYDCAIDLLPGTTPPQGRLFSLSHTERRAMDQ